MSIAIIQDVAMPSRRVRRGSQVAEDIPQGLHDQQLVLTIMAMPATLEHEWRASP
jgi:hypothetical protein